ncbi:MAG TPA: flagellar basal body L-ring protein FlgH [Terriglobales bacterium]|jgi:flagellar L-ring protein precursor FlgH|nr:flagellar basal body L-ring protein FlgH [Terriglobales bacterium]
MKKTLAILLLAISGCAAVSVKAAKEKDKGNSGVIQRESLDEYLRRMQQTSSAAAALSTGSLWVTGSPLTDISSDYKARHVGDLITIIVVQDITATNAGSVSSARNLSASSGISALPAQLKTTNLASLFSPTSAYSLSGKGQAATTSSLRTSLAGRVVAVLPGGSLVIEAERQLTMNNERQTVLLRGLVRPGDVGPSGAVASNSIANLELELKGRGVISEGNRPPNAIVRMILKVVGF